MGCWSADGGVSLRARAPLVAGLTPCVVDTLFLRRAFADIATDPPEFGGSTTQTSGTVGEGVLDET